MSKGSFSKSKQAAGVTAVILLGAGLICLNILVYFRDFEKDLPLRSYPVSEQLLYGSSFAEEGYAPDALIREIIRDREVVLPASPTPYEDYPSYGHLYADDDSYRFPADYFMANNYIYYFMEFSGSTSVDTDLPDRKRLKKEPLPEEVKAGFMPLGRGHDLLRYSFLGNYRDEVCNSQFYYTYWYNQSGYYDEEDRININIAPDGITDEGRLVALWDQKDNLYLMSEGYYDRNIKELYK